MTTSGADASSGVFENIDTAATYDDLTEDLEGTEISSASEAGSALTELDNAISRVDSQRATLDQQSIALSMQLIT